MNATITARGFTQSYSEPATSSTIPWRTPLLAVLLTAYFLFFSWSGLSAHFVGDDMMNMSYSQQLPRSELLLAPFELWKPYYRPLAGWLFVPLLDLFGLDPRPLHAAMLVFVLATTLLIWRLAVLLRAGEWAAWTAAAIAAYHVGVNNLYYNTAFIFDVLCAFFYLATLVYYISIRRASSQLSGRQVCLCLAFYLAALDSKEMAVTLPVILLLYEILYAKSVPLFPRAWFGWLRGVGRGVAACTLLTPLYLYGRIFGGGGLIHAGGYMPEFTRARFWDFQNRTFGDLFLHWPYSGHTGIAITWVALFYLAWRRPRPVLRFTFLMLLLTPIPIEFLLGRGGACNYIPLAAWAIFMAVVAVDVTRGIAWFFSREHMLRRLPASWIAAALLATGLVWWARENIRLKEAFVDPDIRNLSPGLRHAVEGLKELGPHVRPHSTIVFLNDPFDTWDMAFVANLYVNDRTVRVLLHRKTPLTADQIANANCVIDYRDGHFLQVHNDSQ